MKLILKILTFVLLSLFIIYLLLPSPSFPVQPHDSVQSIEDGDVETPLRRAYYTNYSRSEVLEYYQKQIETTFFGITLPAYRLNYPPEDAQWLIRDQTKSTFLEEIVRPLRESLFVNGFEPTDPQFAVSYRGIPYRQHITVKYAPSSVLVRVPIVLVAIIVSFAISRMLLGDVFRATRGFMNNKT